MPTGKWKTRELSNRPWVRKPKNTKPTEKQIIFAKTYLETGSAEEAYVAAGYRDLYVTTSPSRRKFSVERVLYAKGVQMVLKTAREQIIEERKLNLDKIIEGLMLAHSHATTVKEEIAALKEIATLLGYYDKAKVQRINKQVKDQPLGELSQYELEQMLLADKMDEDNVELLPMPPTIHGREDLPFMAFLKDEAEYQYQPLPAES